MSWRLEGHLKQIKKVVYEMKSMVYMYLVYAIVTGKPPYAELHRPVYTRRCSYTTAVVLAAVTKPRGNTAQGNLWIILQRTTDTQAHNSDAVYCAITDVNTRDGVNMCACSCPCGRACMFVCVYPCMPYACIRECVHVCV